MSFKLIHTESIVIAKNMKEEIKSIPPSVCLPKVYDTNINGLHIEYQNALSEFIKTWFNRDITDFLSKKKISPAIS